MIEVGIQLLQTVRRSRSISFKPKLRTIKAEVIVTCEYNGEEIYKYTWSNASFYCDPSESFDIKRKTI